MIEEQTCQYCLMGVLANRLPVSLAINSDSSLANLESWRLFAQSKHPDRVIPSTVVEEDS
jgi:hypothetical protein